MNKATCHEKMPLHPVDSSSSPLYPFEGDASYGWIMLLDIFRATDIPIFLFARSVQCVKRTSLLIDFF